MHSSPLNLGQKISSTQKRDVPILFSKVPSEIREFSKLGSLRIMRGIIIVFPLPVKRGNPNFEYFKKGGANLKKEFRVGETKRGRDFQKERSKPNFSSQI